MWHKMGSLIQPVRADSCRLCILQFMLSHLAWGTRDRTVQVACRSSVEVSCQSWTALCSAWDPEDPTNSSLYSVAGEKRSGVTGVVGVKWCVGFHKSGYPKIVCLYWKIPLKWMITRGTPILGNPQMMSKVYQSVRQSCRWTGDNWRVHHTEHITPGWSLQHGPCQAPSLVPEASCDAHEDVSCWFYPRDRTVHNRSEKRYKDTHST